MDAPQFDPEWMAHAKIAFAALCGGLVRLLFKPTTSLLKTAWLLFGCVTCGYYGTVPTLRWFEMDLTYAGAVGALLGFIGLSLAEGLLKAVDGIDIKGWLLRLLTRGNQT